MNDPVKLHKWVSNYNWDDGLSPIWPIVESKNTELGTALLIYWRLDGPELLSEGVNAEAKRLQDLVKLQILNNYYPRSLVHYDPVQDNNLSETRLYQYRKTGIPQVLLEAT